jgi:polar amino acid transport system permease protein
VVGYQELALATRLAGASTKHYFIFFLASALIYLALTVVSNALFNLLERRVRRGQPKLA